MLDFAISQLLDNNGAGSTSALPAAELGAFQPSLRADEIEQGSFGVDVVEGESGAV